MFGIIQSCSIVSGNGLALNQYWSSLQGLFYKDGSTLIQAWISNHMHSKVWDEITFSWSLGMDK